MQSSSTYSQYFDCLTVVPTDVVKTELSIDTLINNLFSHFMRLMMIEASAKAFSHRSTAVLAAQHQSVPHEAEVAYLKARTRTAHDRRLGGTCRRLADALMEAAAVVLTAVRAHGRAQLMGRILHSGGAAIGDVALVMPRDTVVAILELSLLVLVLITTVRSCFQAARGLASSRS